MPHENSLPANPSDRPQTADRPIIESAEQLLTDSLNRLVSCTERTNTMSIYYSAKLDTEAGQRAEQYFNKSNENRKRLHAKLEEMGLTVKRVYTKNSNGEPAAFIFKEGKPEGWIHPRNCGSAYFPKRTKENKQLISDIASMKLGGNEAYCKAMFNAAPLIFRGMSIINGIAGGVFGDRAVVIFKDDEHAAELKKAGDWPKGLRKIKESSYYRLKEATAWSA